MSVAAPPRPRTIARRNPTSRRCHAVHRPGTPAALWSGIGNWSRSSQSEARWCGSGGAAMRASIGTCLRSGVFRSNIVRILGIGALSLHLAAAEDDCTIRILVGEGEGECEGEGEGEGELDSDGDGLLDADELAIGTGPFNPDTDGDGLLDGQEAFCAYP